MKHRSTYSLLTIYILLYPFIAELAKTPPANISLLLRGVEPAAAYAFSNNFPFLANAGTGEIALSANWSDPRNSTRDIISWFAAKDPLTFEQQLNLEPLKLEEIYNPDLVALYAEGRARGDLGACNNPSNTTVFLCKAFVENGLWGALQNDVSFPTSLCYSKEDEVVGYVNFPTNNTNPNVKPYQPFIAALAPQGGHLEANVFCILDPISALALASGANTPTSMAPLDNPPPQCRKGTTSQKSNSNSTAPPATSTQQTNPQTSPSTSNGVSPTKSPVASNVGVNPTSSPATAKGGHSPTEAPAALKNGGMPTSGIKIGQIYSWANLITIVCLMGTVLVL